MTKKEKIVEARDVMLTLTEIGRRPYLKGEWLMYDNPATLPSGLLMRAMAVSDQMYDLLKEKQNGKSK